MYALYASRFLARRSAAVFVGIGSLLWSPARTTG